MPVSGIYKITNLINGKFYIGSSVDCKRRWKREYNIHLCRAFQKYGKENFSFEIIEECERKILFQREQYYLDTLKPWDRKIGYNLSNIATGGNGLRGNKHPHVKLTEQDVKEIKYMFFIEEKSYKELLKIYDFISMGTLEDILNGRTWRHLLTKEDLENIEKPKNRWEKGSKHTKESLMKISQRSRGENNPSSKLTWEKVEEIRKLHASGKIGYRKLSKIFNISKTTISDIIKNKIWRKEEKNPKSKLSWKEVSLIRKKYNENNILIKEIAKEYKLSCSAVQHIIENRNWYDSNYTIPPKRKRSGQNNNSAKLTKRQVEEIRFRYKNEKIFQKDLAKEYGVNRMTILRIINNKTWKK